jgi:hypothetical protein
VSPAQGPRRLGRSVLAVIAGLLAGAVLSVGTDQVLHATNVFPPWGRPMSGPLFALAAAYRIAYTVLGCAVGARLAPDRPMGHALLLGLLGLLANVAGTIATWDQGPEFGPKWYPLLLAATAIPCGWLGGRLGERTPGSAEEPL